jgi:hypothetical protein
MNKNLKGSSTALALIKFFEKEEHYNKFKNGDLLFRTPHYYRMCEDIGRGDRSESCAGFWDRSLGDEIPTSMFTDPPIDLTKVQSLLIYPAHEQKDAWLQSWCLIDLDNAFHESLEQMIKEFGTYFVILPSKNVAKYIASLENATGLPVRSGLLHYSEDPLTGSLTTKNSKFSYQKEFRFYLGECEKNETQDKFLKVENIKDIIPEAGSLKLTCSGKTAYFALGQKNALFV